MSRPTSKSKKPRVNMTLDPLITKESKLICAKEGMSLSELVESLLSAYNKEIHGAQRTRQALLVEIAALRVKGD